jgi:hypothetical protein
MQGVVQNPGRLAAPRLKVQLGQPDVMNGRERSSDEVLDELKHPERLAAGRL